jgi:hypothetical protein
MSSTRFDQPRYEAFDGSHLNLNDQSHTKMLHEFLDQPLTKLHRETSSSDRSWTKHPHDDPEGDIPLSTRDFLNPKPPESQEKSGKQIAEFIKDHSDFGNEFLRGPIEDLFKVAMKHGQLRELIDAVNKELKAAGSPLQLDAFETTERVHYTQDVGNKTIAPREIDATNPRAEIRIVNTATSKTVDGMRVGVDPRLPGFYYPPQVATSRVSPLFGAQSD